MLDQAVLYYYFLSLIDAIQLVYKIHVVIFLIYYLINLVFLTFLFQLANLPINYCVTIKIVEIYYITFHIQFFYE